MQHFLAAVALSLVVCPSPVIAQDGANGLEVRPDPKNVVANSLVGTWRLDPLLNKRLGHRVGQKGGEDCIEFRDDAKALKKVPAAIARKLAEARIYLAGTMRKGDKEHAFLLTLYAGNPVVVWFRERNGDPLGDAESWNVTIVRAEARQADMLFVGGDSNNQSFAAYKRETKVVGKLEPIAALTEMIRLLEAGKAREFLETYCAPDDLGEVIEQGGTMEKLVDRFKGERVKVLIDTLTAASKRPPVMIDGDDIASWELDKAGGTPGKLRLQRIDGRWYLRNR